MSYAALTIFSFLNIRCIRFLSSTKRINLCIMASDTAHASSSAHIDMQNPEDLYEKAEEYWAQATRDNDGMLGGFAELHKPDITQSRSFLTALHKKNALRNNGYALDCGAGIGRVTKALLLPAFKKVDMVDVVKELIDKSHTYIGAHSNMGERFVSGLQDFEPEPAKYDLIWIQWVSGHLTNAHFIDFFKRCQVGLREHGVICLKDNIAPQKESVFDCEDHSWTRPQQLIEELLVKSGLDIIAKEDQRAFPKGMYKVTMFAMKPRSNGASSPSTKLSVKKANLPTLI